MVKDIEVGTVVKTVALLPVKVGGAAITVALGGKNSPAYRRFRRKSRERFERCWDACFDRIFDVMYNRKL